MTSADAGRCKTRSLSPIFIVGAPRSGTTWLAKIIDSHPDVLYRHEPDETLPCPSGLLASEVKAVVARWAADRGARTVTKRPFFRKSHQAGWQRGVRVAAAAMASAAGRLPPPFQAIASLPIPDLMLRPAARLAIKSIRLGEAIAVFAEALPESRTLFILRHPCGQVASVMRGTRQRRFDLKTAGTDMPFDEAAAIRFAGRFGLAKADFQALPDAAKYAWSWRAFNEPACAALAGRANSRIVFYEGLCAEPEAEARRNLAFCGLDWNTQTQDFVAYSANHDGEAGYYAVVRNAAEAAQGWRSLMPATDQDAVRAVVADSPLARMWPDLVK